MNLKTALPSVVLLGAPLLAQTSLDQMPAYQPRQVLSGRILVAGATYEKLVTSWESAFQEVQPKIKIVNSLQSGDGFVGALESGGADLSFSDRDPMVSDSLSYFETFNRELARTQIDIATGSLAFIWPITFYVRKDNPLNELTVKQADGIFGAERNGGWAGFRWFPQFGRGPEEDIRTWGQLGLTGEWADQPIHTYGYAAPGPKNHFELYVLHGGNKWNPNLKQFVSAGTKTVADGPIGATGSSDYMVKTLMAQDKLGICWAPGKLPEGANLKSLALSEGEGKPAIPCTDDTVKSWTYPLTRAVHTFVNRMPGKAMDPCAKEFLYFILSRQGQEITLREGTLLPLPARIVAEQRKLIDDWAN